MATENPTTQKGAPDSQAGGDAPTENRKDVRQAGQVPPNPPADTTVNQDADPDEVFRQEQQAAAALQNQRGEGAVPEQRPQAFLNPRPEDIESRVHLELKEAGHPLVDNTPMGREAYERAASKSQAEKAADSERRATLREGTAIRITNGKKGMDGRNAVIITVNYPTDQAQLRELGGAEAAYAEPESYIIRTRDGRTDTFEVKPDEVTEVPRADWGRSGI